MNASYDIPARYSAEEQTSIANDIKILKNKIDDLRHAMFDSNAEKLKGLSVHQLSYGHSGGNVENQQELIANIVSGKSDFIKIT